MAVKQTNDDSALNNLGYVYENGYGVLKNPAKCYSYYQEAAERGNVKAMCSLGWCYYSGIYVAINYTEAIKWFKQAIERGNLQAYNNLGLCYQFGNGIPQDY